MKALNVYLGSDGKVTTAYYEELMKRGPIGEVAVNLFRAHKCSSRAKKYHGGIRGRGSYKGMAYDRKDWSLQNLSRVLCERAAELGITWGWKLDPNTPGYEWVCYVELPGIGQCSFHCAQRHAGPDYPGDWDGKHLSAERIIQFCDRVMEGVLV